MVERIYKTKEKAVKPKARTVKTKKNTVKSTPAKKTSTKKTPAKGRTVKRVDAPRPAQLYRADIYARGKRDFYGGRKVGQTEPVRSFSALVASVVKGLDSQNGYAVVYRADRLIGYIYRGNCYYPNNTYSADCYIWKYAQDAQKGRDRIYELALVWDKWDFYDFHKPGMEYDGDEE